MYTASCCIRGTYLNLFYNSADFYSRLGGGFKILKALSLPTATKE